MKKPLTIVLLIAVAIAAWIAWSTRTKPVRGVVEPATRGPVEKTVANTRAGTVKACRRAKLSPSAGGQIAQLPVSEGDSVKRGQLLLELWNKDLTAQLTLTQQEATSAAGSSRYIRAISSPASGASWSIFLPRPRTARATVSSR